MKAIQIEAFGSPPEVVKAVDTPDVGAPAAGEVVLALEASPINQYDLLMLASGYDLILVARNRERLEALLPNLSRATPAERYKVKAHGVVAAAQHLGGTPDVTIAERPRPL